MIPWKYDTENYNPTSDVYLRMPRNFYLDVQYDDDNVKLQNYYKGSLAFSKLLIGLPPLERPSFFASSPQKQM